jgi:hypothetical protein
VRALPDKLLYNGQDITLDIVIKAEHVVTLIAEQQGRAFDDVYRDFIASRTYTALINTASLMWAESAEFITDDYFRELSRDKRKIRDTAGTVLFE